MDLTPEPASNIIALNGSVEQQLEITRKVRERQYQCSGLHKNVLVDSEKRTVTCKDCGYVIDPFDYLERWAAEGDMRMQELETLKIKVRVRSAEHMTLERNIKNIRQQLKRAGSPQSEEERREFDLMEWNPKNVELQERLRLIEGGLKKA